MEKNYPFFAKSAREKRRELGLAGQNEKRVRQPWSLIIIFATLVPVVLFAKLQNIYAFIVTTLWMGNIL
jgi:phospho-N-acetylmuramoyl-pentapeptide-transferase